MTPDYFVSDWPPGQPLTAVVNYVKIRPGCSITECALAACYPWSKYETKKYVREALELGLIENQGTDQRSRLYAAEKTLTSVRKCERGTVN